MGAGPPGKRREKSHAQLPLLDRLIDEAPDSPHDAPLPTSEAISTLRDGVRRDLEALLNARRRWRSWPASLTELTVSSVGYGIPDFTAGAFNDPARREALRAEIEATIRRFEPRLVSLRVKLLDNANQLEPTLRLRIDGLLHAEPAPEPISFNTVMDATTANVVVRNPGDAWTASG